MISRRNVILAFWFASIITAFTMAHFGPVSWDFDVYWKAAEAVHHGIDPYAEGIAVQRAFHAIANHDPLTHAPMTYVYSPMTLPLLRLVGGLPAPLIQATFLLALACGFGLQLWTGWQMATPAERRWLGYLLPAVAFFPGLLVDDVLLSGNIAYLLYGLILAAAVPGWKRGRWEWYYLTVLLASCFKAPMLTMLALPLLLGRRQWSAAIATGLAGSLLFLSQSVVWPDLYREYLTAVQLQFDFNSDFGFSPSGMLGEFLSQHGLPYKDATIFLYLLFAAIMLGMLFFTASKARGNSRAMQNWLPIAVLGTLLLNPRIKEYDVAAVTVPLILIGSRLLSLLFPSQVDNSSPRPRLISGDKRRAAASGASWRDRLIPPLFAFGWFLAANCATSGDTWKPIELSILLTGFGAAAWKLVSETQKIREPHRPDNAVSRTMKGSLRISVESREAS